MGAWTTNGKFIVFGGYYKWTAASTQHASEIAYAMNAHDANCDEITTLRARIAELERERVELDARVAAMEPFMAMGAAHTPGAFGPACMDCGASMIGVERCQHCGGKH